MSVQALNCLCLHLGHGYLDRIIDEVDRRVLPIARRMGTAHRLQLLLFHDAFSVHCGVWDKLLHMDVFYLPVRSRTSARIFK